MIRKENQESLVSCKSRWESNSRKKVWSVLLDTTGSKGGEGSMCWKHQTMWGHHSYKLIISYHPVSFSLTVKEWHHSVGQQGPSFSKTLSNILSEAISDTDRSELQDEFNRESN